MSRWCCAVCRIAELKKDLYYYKTTTREFKKKLRTASREGTHGEPDARRASTEPPAGTHRDTAAAGDSAVMSHGMC